MQKSLLITLCVILIGSLLFATDPWGEPVYYPGSMTVMAQVSINGSPAASGDVLGAFVYVNGDPELRGKANVMVINDISGCILQVFCPANGEIIHFRVWDEDVQLEYHILETVNSVVNGEIGSYPDDLYQINVEAGELLAPEISPPGGVFHEAQTVSVTSPTAGAEIRYSLNGADPTQSSSLYSSPIVIHQSCVLKARAFLPGWDPGPVASAEFSIINQVANPVFTPAAGSYNYPIVLQMFCATSGATIHYSLDGSDPGEETAIYTGPMLISQTTLVKARAYLNDWFPSEVTSAHYSLPSATEEEVVQNPEPGILSIYPNPFNREATIELHGKGYEQAYYFRIYNLKGQCVFSTSGLASGTFNIVWDGKDAMGIRLPRGMYFASFSQGDLRFVRKLILQ